MQPAAVKRVEFFQLEPGKEILQAVAGVEGAGGDEAGEAVGADVVHSNDDAARDLDPVQNLGFVEGALVLAELDRLVRARDERGEVVGEAAVGTALVVGVQQDEVLLCVAALDRADRVPGVVAVEDGGGASGVEVADAVGRVEGVELVFEHGG